MREPEGVFLRMQDAALFESGSAGVEGARAGTLERLGDIARLIEVPVVVTGHTDNTPIRSPVFRSNWELSAARAAGVARALVERGQDPMLVTVESYGEHRPIAENDSPEGRAQNRRVELYYSRQGVMSTLIERGLLPDPATVSDGG
jgi:chemotaxis protein MotB